MGAISFAEFPYFSIQKEHRWLYLEKDDKDIP